MPTFPSATHRGFPCQFACALLAFFICTPAAVNAAQETFTFTGRGRDGKPLTVKAPLANIGHNTAKPDQNAADDATYGKQYRRVGPADSRFNCAGDVSNSLFGTGERGFQVETFKTRIIDNFGRPTSNPRKGDVVIFGDNAHIATVVGVTKDPNVVIIRSKDNQESVREGPLTLKPWPWAPTDPIVHKNGTPVVYHVDPLQVTPPPGVNLQRPRYPPVRVGPSPGPHPEPQPSEPEPPPPPPIKTTTSQEPGKPSGGSTQRRDQQGHDARNDALAASRSGSQTARGAASVGAALTGGRPAMPPAHIHTHTHCFVAGTLVHTPSGSRRIEDLEVDDRVLSFDERTGRIEPALVTHTWKSQRADLIRLGLPGGTVTCSQNHRFYTAEKQWLTANQLAPGGKIMLRDPASPRRLTAVACTLAPLRLKSPIAVYNITVAGNSNYFVGPDAVLCHNTK